jgi:hypothetical protein
MKYKFNKDWWGGTYVPPTSGMATRRVEFKQGDIVEGNIIRNELNSEPPNFIVVNSPQGIVHIPFGGRVNILERPSAADTSMITGDMRTGDVKEFFGPKGLGDKVFMLGIIALTLFIAACFIRIIIKKGKI